VGKTVKEADHNKDEGVSDHDYFVSQPVDDSAYQRAAQYAETGAYGIEQGHDRGIGPIMENQHIGRKGKKYLLARAVENFQHIELEEFFWQNKSAVFGI